MRLRIRFYKFGTSILNDGALVFEVGFHHHCGKKKQKTGNWGCFFRTRQRMCLHPLGCKNMQNLRKEACFWSYLQISEREVKGMIRNDMILFAQNRGQRPNYNVHESRKKAQLGQKIQ